jgi:DNA-binding beta-propeller fold protein YncE
MRMKFNKSSQMLLVSAASLLAAGLMVACATATTDFVYVTSAKAAGTNSYGEVDVFEINYVSGMMRQIPTSPFFSGGRDPVAEAVSSDYSNLYVVNQDDNSIVQFVIGNDGKLYPQNTVNTPGIYPLAIAVNGSNLFVVDTFQPLNTCSTAAPCSGAVGVLPLSASSGSTPGGVPETPVANGNLNYWPLALPGSPNDVLEPTAINVLASGSYIYVTAYDATASANYLFGFSVGSGGALTALNSGAPLGGAPFATGSCSYTYAIAPYVSGTCSATIASDSSSSYVYVTNARNGTVLGYAVGSGGLLTPLSGNPYPAGNQPSAIVADSKYPYLYVANAQDGNVSAYSIGSGGALTSIGTYAAGVEPVAIGIDPSTNHFLFTANFTPDGVSGTVSDFELSATNGTLINTQNSPYASNAQPTAVAAIPHGRSM